MKRPLRRQIPTAATLARSREIAELLRARGALSFNAYIGGPPPDAVGSNHMVYPYTAGGEASRWLLNRGTLGDPGPI